MFMMMFMTTKITMMTLVLRCLSMTITNTSWRRKACQRRGLTELIFRWNIFLTFVTYITYGICGDNFEETFQVLTCEERARVGSVCPKHGVCHPRLTIIWCWLLLRFLGWPSSYDEYFDLKWCTSQLLRGLGGAWKRRSLRVSKFPQHKVKWKVGRGENEVQKGESCVRRFPPRSNKIPDSSWSTQM